MSNLSDQKQTYDNKSMILCSMPQAQHEALGRQVRAGKYNSLLLCCLVYIYICIYNTHYFSLSLYIYNIYIYIKQKYIYIYIYIYKPRLLCCLLLREQLLRGLLRGLRRPACAAIMNNNSNNMFSTFDNMLKPTISPQAKRAETDPRQGTPTRAHFQPPEGWDRRRMFGDSSLRRRRPTPDVPCGTSRGRREIVLIVQ